MRQKIFFPLLSIVVLIILMLACAQTPSSDGSLRDIACALQGIPPSECNQDPSGGGGGSGSGPPDPTPLKIETLVPSPTPTVRPVNHLQVVYAKDGNIWLWDDASGSVTQVTNSGQDSAPKISDDGLVIAFHRKGELWAVGPDGSQPRVLASSAALLALLPAGVEAVAPRQFDFAPRSHDVYLNVTSVSQEASVPEYNLAKVNADVPTLDSLLNSSQGGGQFIFSPDGTKIALPRNDKINVVDLDGSNLRTVFTFPRVLLHADANYVPQIAWMAGSSAFTTVIPPEDGVNNPSDPTRFYYIPIEGDDRQPAQLAQFVAAPAFQSQPYISPDAAKVVYTRPNGANLEVHVIDASTTDELYFQYPANRIGLLGWAPDSTQIMYWIDDSRIAWIASPGTEPALLSDVNFAVNINWVDTRRYFFLAGTELRLRTLDQPGTLIDGRLSDFIFDFTITSFGEGQP